MAEKNPYFTYITVKAKRNDGRVAFWERHVAHLGEDGEVFIVGDDSGEEFEVALTPGVYQALFDKRLEEVKKTRSSKDTSDVDKGLAPDSGVAATDAAVSPPDDGAKPKPGRKTT